ncbi:MAG TPA: zinc-dependent metalloprotease, partial [Gemmatimonadaceae bacterium]|nr:zinc-dependent metalloprotease [Gemmatimonadaceae bacterium]
MSRRSLLPGARAAALPLLVVAAGCARSATPAPAPALATAAAAGAAAARGPASSIAARTVGLVRQDGLLPLYVDDRTGKLLLEIPADSMRVLLAVTGATGLGSNPIGVDRGADGESWVARFDRAGEQVLVVFENWSYRSSGDADNRRTVRESFPPSTVAALPLLAVEGGRLLVDATDFALRDWMHVGRTLQRSGEGSYAVAKDRSRIHRPYTKAFPRNTEVDVALTFAASGNPGRTVSRLVPDGSAFTLRQHLSFLALPDDTYRPRRMDPRVGYFGITFKDYAQPLQGSLEQRWIARHRLERANPADPNSPIRNPIVYYVDRGIPEPVRTATLEGVRWWSDAFDRAGLRGAFRVELLPEGVDPMDARYNVVQWVNRNERGWSIGGSLGDPRTGEIVKAMARMDSHRARTDYNLYAGLMGADAAAADTAFVLARVRQVSAHEVGHTLGLAHNYIASTYERGSVMDYPPPRVRLNGAGDIDVTQAYDAGPGEYDVWAIRWGYGIFPAGSEEDSLRAIAAAGLRAGYLFLSDADARPGFAADPRTNLWDDAATADEFLTHQMDVRRVALRRFGERNIRPGEPVALLQERFAPVYLMHRFAINSLAKTVGGMEYANALRGDGLQATRPIDARRQRAALAQLLGALAPAELAIPDTVLTLLAPRPYGYPGSVELFGARTAPAFDELGAARTLAQMVVDALLQRERAARLVQFAAREADALSFGETVDRLVAVTWEAPAPVLPRLAALQRVTQRAVTDRLLQLAADTVAAPEVRAMAGFKLRALQASAARRMRTGGDVARAHWMAIHDDVERWLEHGVL